MRWTTLLFVLLAFAGAQFYSRVPGNMLSFLGVIKRVAWGGELAKGFDVGDGREERVHQYVLKNAPKNNMTAVLDVYDDYGWNKEFFMSIGNVKGKILDEAVLNCTPKVSLEIGGYLGYSAVRISRLLSDDAKLFSVEPHGPNVAIARSIIEHAGASGKVEVLQMFLKDAIEVFREKGIEAFDFVFVDHVKVGYVSDLELLRTNGFLKKGTVVVADNVRMPGAPEYTKYMASSTEFETTRFDTMFEYTPFFADVVLVSVYKG